MKLFVTVYNDAKLLNHFVRHYAAAGVSEFYIAAAPRWESQVRQMTAGHRIVLFVDLPPIGADLDPGPAISEMRRLHQADDEWVTVVDLDEFIEFPDGITVAQLAAEAELDGANVVRGIMHDRFSADGRLPEYGPDSDLSAVFPVKSRFIRDVMDACDHKGVLVKGLLKCPPTGGHHWLEGERLAKRLLEISHYKWTPGSIDRLRASYRNATKAGITWVSQYKTVIDHYDSHGRFAWEEFGGRFSSDFLIEAPQRCLECRAPVSEAEFNYSTKHFGMILCRADQASRRAAINVA